MPHDHRLWTKVLNIMQAWENFHPDTKETPDEYRRRSVRVFHGAGSFESRGPWVFG